MLWGRRRRWERVGCWISLGTSQGWDPQQLSLCYFAGLSLLLTSHSLFKFSFSLKKNEPSSSPVFKKIDSSYLCTCLFNSVYESDSVEKMASRSFWLLRHRLAKGWFTAYMRIDQQIPGSLPTDSPAYLTKWAARQAGVPLKYQPCMHHSFPPETQKPLYKHHLSPKSMWCVSPVFQTLIIWVE